MKGLARLLVLTRTPDKRAVIFIGIKVTTLKMSPIERGIDPPFTRAVYERTDHGGYWMLDCVLELRGGVADQATFSCRGRPVGELTLKPLRRA